ncbi:MAG: 3-phosphoshikimate 1-carboxyvinyltransferase, partial [Lentisphaerae bacterium]
MIFQIRPSRLNGTVRIPTSKSHTIRAFLLSALTGSRSIIRHPLQSLDTRAALNILNAIGTKVEEEEDFWVIDAIDRDQIPDGLELDVMNSGTTLRIATGILALASEHTANILTGDQQLQRRPCQPLIDALNQLGANVESLRGNGCAPLRVRGQLKGGSVSIECPTSQYLTALLIAATAAEGVTEIHVPLLNEKPYIDITLYWLRHYQNAGIEFNSDYSWFKVTPNGKFRPFEATIPADYSSAAFFFAAGAIPGNQIKALGLKFDDPQPDKAFLDFIEEMGARVERREPDTVVVTGRELHGGEFDL